MRRGSHLPQSQAEVTFSDVFVGQLTDFSTHEQEVILGDLVGLCETPWGKHPLSTPLDGWNTEEVLGRRFRVVYKAGVIDSVGSIEVLCIGPRSNDEVYDMASGLVSSGILTKDEITSLWNALAILDVVAENAGLDGWDYRPQPAPVGMQKAAVAARLLSPEQASVLSKDELEAAMTAGWSDGEPDPLAALHAALERARGRSAPPVLPHEVLASRRADRCGDILPRAQRPCVRREGHPGPHRST